MGICKNYPEAKEQAQRNADTFHKPYVAFIDTSGNARTDSLATFDKSLPDGAETIYPTIAHTPEPWHAGAGNGEGSIFADKDGLRMRMTDKGTALYPIATVGYGYEAREDDANMARIVACVNGCEGVPNPGAVRDLLQFAQRTVDWIRSLPPGGLDVIDAPRACLLGDGIAAIAKTKWSTMTAFQLDAKYQADIQALGKIWKKGDPPCPPCPRCGGTVKPWEAHIVTGAECVECKWSMSEGSGALV